MTKEFNSLKEIQKYYVKEINTYVFKENGVYIDLVVFNFDFNSKTRSIKAFVINANDINADCIDVQDIKASNIKAYTINAGFVNANDISVFDIKAWEINVHDINARNINSWHITARDINANDIGAFDIKARNINYYAVCYAYESIKCKSIKGRMENSKHFVLNGALEVEEQ